VQSSDSLLRSNILGRAIAVQLLAAEKRSGEAEALKTLLAIDASPTHVIRFGLEFRRDGSKKELFAAALNFRLPGWDGNYIARECCDFLTFIAKDQEAFLDAEGRLCPPPLLTQSKIYVREFWATAVFRRYRRFALGTE
jgi:hypothetical protein